METVKWTNAIELKKGDRIQINGIFRTLADVDITKKGRVFLSFKMYLHEVGESFITLGTVEPNHKVKLLQDGTN